mmetsp:Transcript_23176/g.22650  ORF Transcript_23176/g.22650 Transcript_23176/m.22650 type:complete len:89 (-) Transcript_23176:639-905(-)
MEYAKSYQQWLQNAEKSKDSITVIKDFEMNMRLSLKKDQSFIGESLYKQQTSPDTIIEGDMTELKLFFNPHIYNSFLNIGQLLTVESS